VPLRGHVRAQFIAGKETVAREEVAALSLAPIEGDNARAGRVGGSDVAGRTLGCCVVLVC
jgi:hypothetical protein